MALNFIQSLLVQRQELFYVRWLKEKIPALRPYGVTDDKTPKEDH